MKLPILPQRGDLQAPRTFPRPLQEKKKTLEVWKKASAREVIPEQSDAQSSAVIRVRRRSCLCFRE
jgi:hypothetical protein